MYNIDCISSSLEDVSLLLGTNKEDNGFLKWRTIAEPPESPINI